jgi:hypothetical protein
MSRSIAEEFGLDLAALSEMKAAAAEAFAYERDTMPGGGWSEREAAALEALDAPLWETVRWLYELEYVLGEDEGIIHRLADRLAEVGRKARAIPRKWRGRGQRQVRLGNRANEIAFDLAPIRAAMEIIVAYWRGLGHEFQQNQATDWETVDGFYRPAPDAHEGVRFAYRIIESFAPGQGGAVRTIARYYVAGNNP